MNNLAYEYQARLAGYSLVAGIDEAGRGPLAGPVVAAAVILPEDIALNGVKDSKKMSSRSREKSYSIIRKKAVDISLAVVSPQEIDEINILQATRKAMKLAVLGLDPQPDYLLVDGTQDIDLPICQKYIIKGDQLSLSISAASVLAKVYRDRIMNSYHKLYPMYDFCSNKGYGTPRHIQAIDEHGPCCIHRLTFRGVLR
jgi:ribonuclease HII